MEKQETMPLGVVVEWRRVEHPWKDHDWRPVAVIAGAPPLDPAAPWRLLREGDGWRQYHAGTLALDLFRSEVEAYRINLSQTPPRIFVVLRSSQDASATHEVIPFLVTADPFEAQHYLDSGEEIVEPVAMPPEILAFVQDFVAAHPTQEVFTKRRRKNPKGREDPFSRRPPVERPAGRSDDVAGGGAGGGEG